MQEAAFRATRLDWTYRLLDVEPESLAPTVQQLRDPEWAGANVTIPYKQTVLALLDDVDSTGRGVGAVNLIRREGRRLLGSNTDVDGIRAALAELGMTPSADLDIVVLGVGGSARACAVAFAGARITWVSRGSSRPALGGNVVSWEGPQWHELARAADLLVNTTPIGREGDLPCAPEDLPREGSVIDLVYAEPTTPLVAAARAAGRPAADGWTVLLGQGAATFEAWTGLDAPLAAMRAALPT